MEGLGRVGEGEGKGKGMTNTEGREEGNRDGIWKSLGSVCEGERRTGKEGRKGIGKHGMKLNFRMW